MKSHNNNNNPPPAAFLTDPQPVHAQRKDSKHTQMQILPSVLHPGGSLTRRYSSLPKIFMVSLMAASLSGVLPRPRCRAVMRGVPRAGKGGRALSSPRPTAQGPPGLVLLLGRPRQNRLLQQSAHSMRFAGGPPATSPPTTPPPGPAASLSESISLAHRLISIQLLPRDRGGPEDVRKSAAPGRWLCWVTLDPPEIVASPLHVGLSMGRPLQGGRHTPPLANARLWACPVGGDKTAPYGCQVAVFILKPAH